jgi:hypothetical protein
VGVVRAENCGVDGGMAGGDLGLIEMMLYVMSDGDVG